MPKVREYREAGGNGSAESRRAAALERLGRQPARYLPLPAAARPALGLESSPLRATAARLLAGPGPAALGPGLHPMFTPHPKAAPKAWDPAPAHTPQPAPAAAATAGPGPGTPHPSRRQLVTRTVMMDMAVEDLEAEPPAPDDLRLPPIQPRPSVPQRQEPGPAPDDGPGLTARPLTRRGAAAEGHGPAPSRAAAPAPAPDTKAKAALPAPASAAPRIVLPDDLEPGGAGFQAPELHLTVPRASLSRPALGAGAQTSAPVLYTNTRTSPVSLALADPDGLDIDTTYLHSQRGAKLMELPPGESCSYAVEPQELISITTDALADSIKYVLKDEAGRTLAHVLFTFA